AEQRREIGLDHQRSGDFVLLAKPGSWFTYYFWLDDERAPDYARTVDIHRKPGYDPVELFIDPAISFPKLKIGMRLLQKNLGMNALMDVISTDAGFVRGSHARPATSAETGPLLISNQPRLIETDPIDPVDVRALILRHVFST